MPGGRATGAGRRRIRQRRKRTWFGYDRFRHCHLDDDRKRKRETRGLGRETAKSLVRAININDTGDRLLGGGEVVTLAINEVTPLDDSFKIVSNWPRTLRSKLRASVVFRYF